MSVSQFDRFTPSARRALALAHRAAVSLNQNQISTEHILLGLLDEDVGVATELLRGEGITYSAAKQAAVTVFQQSTYADYPGEGTRITPDAKRVVQDAAQVADRFGDHEVRPEHILYSLLSQDSPKVLLIMNGLGKSKDKLLAQLVGLLTGGKSV